MIKIEDIAIGNKKAKGMAIKIPGSTHADLLMVICDKGFAMCAYMDISTAERLNDAAIILNSRDLTGILDVEVSKATKRAMDLGIRIGMPGREALKILMD